MQKAPTTPLGAGIDAYRERAPGMSPDGIRDTVWRMIEGQLGGVVLDAGCGAGGWTRRVRAHPRVSEVLGVDLLDSGAAAVPGVSFRAADLSMEPLPAFDRSVDWVFALEVLEHLSNPRHFVRQVHRVLRDGGRFVLTTPSNESLRARLSYLVRGYFPAFCEHDYRGSGHITPITSLDLKRMADEVGFRATHIEFPFEGAIPMSRVAWQGLLPSLRGGLWSDGLMAVLTR